MVARSLIELHQVLNLRTWTFNMGQKANLGSNGYLLHQGAANNTSTLIYIL